MYELQRMERYYRTMRAARVALALDTGFDPFLSGGWGRCTKAKLADSGYVVDPRKAAELERGHHCSVCQTELTEEENGTARVWPTECPEHRKYSYECDRGHRWRATDAEDLAAGHKCPRCGGYWN